MGETANTATTSEQGGAQRLPHLPGLDGLRALALLGVMGFHGGITWLKGGYLPLTVFFTLSGFLISSLLLLEVNSRGKIDLRQFWVRRARRLVPAALLGVAFALAYGAASEPSMLTRLRGDALSALAWVTNWRFVFQGRSYAESFTVPSPLQHYWSLAVEEQFYLTFPLILTALLAIGRGRRWVVAAGVGAMAVASAIWMAVLYTPAAGPLRSYYGTDARAAELLIGVLLALALIGPHGLRRIEGRAARIAIDAMGLVALGVTLTLWVVVHEFSAWLFEGGMVGLAVLAAAIVLAASQPGTLVSRIVGIKPLALLGKISYGSYVIHWPVFLYVSPARTHLSTYPLFALRFGIVLVLAMASYALMEQPIRIGKALKARVAALSWANASIGLAAGIALITSSTGALPTVTLRAAGDVLPPPPPVVDSALVSTAGTPSGATPIEAPTTAPTAAPTTAAGPTTTAGSVAAQAPSTTAPTVPATTVPPPPPPTKILVIGDSISQNMATGLTRWGKNTNAAVVWDHGIAACPVTRGGDRRTMAGSYAIPAGCDWWGTATAAAEIAKWDPDVILMVGGLNDLFDRKVDGWDRYYSPGDATFDAWMMSEYKAAADALSKDGRPVAWAPPPCLDWTPYTPHILPEEGEWDPLESTCRHASLSIL